MRTVSPELQALIDAGTAKFVNLWKVKRRDGTIYANTAHDQNLTVDLGDGDGAAVYLSGGIVEEYEVETTSGVSVDNGELEGALASIGAFVTKDDILSGRFDGAEVTMARCHWPDPSIGADIISFGVLADASTENGRYILASRSLTSLLEADVAVTIQPECTNKFGDALCGFDLTNFIHDGEITSITDARRYVTDVVQVTDYFAGGIIEFTSGRNMGGEYDLVASDDTGTVEIFMPPLLPVAVGDTVRLTYGCRKLISDCNVRGRFATGFRGFPYVPGVKLRNQRGTK